MNFYVIVDENRNITSLFSSNDGRQIDPITTIEVDENTWNALPRDIYLEDDSFKYQLNQDNTVSENALPIGFVPKNNSAMAMTMPDLLSQVPEALIQIINYVVNGQPIPQDVIDSWNAAYSAHEDALAQGVTP